MALLEKPTSDAREKREDVVSFPDTKRPIVLGMTVAGVRDVADFTTSTGGGEKVVRLNCGEQ